MWSSRYSHTSMDPPLFSSPPLFPTHPAPAYVPSSLSLFTLHCFIPLLIIQPIAAQTGRRCTPSGARATCLRGGARACSLASWRQARTAPPARAPPAAPTGPMTGMGGERAAKGEEDGRKPEQAQRSRHGRRRSVPHTLSPSSFLTPLPSASTPAPISSPLDSLSPTHPLSLSLAA
jgi:hypothetical protein